jgi:hypothetical protein
MPSIYMHPDGAGVQTTIVSGRKYTATPGTPILVPDFDANVLAANGWLVVGNVGGAVGAGITSARPVNPKKGDSYMDTTLNALVMWDNKNWRNHATGAIV